MRRVLAVRNAVLDVVLIAILVATITGRGSLWFLPMLGMLGAHYQLELERIVDACREPTKPLED